MTAPTTVRSAYPPSLEELLPKAHALAERLGQIPSRNRLMRELRVGAPKATALREALAGVVPPPAPATPPTGLGDSAPLVAPNPSPAASTGEPATSGTPVAAPTGTQAPPQVAGNGHPDTGPAAISTEGDRPEIGARRRAGRRPVAWPVLLLAAPAFVAIWSGWVELGALAGFGVVHPLPGIADDFRINTAITLPIGMEAYAAYALWVWLSDRAPARARRFARWSALLALVVGAAGQVAYHLMAAAGITVAPWPITTAVACLPVAVLGMGAALAHLLHASDGALAGR